MYLEQLSWSSGKFSGMSLGTPQEVKMLLGHNPMNPKRNRSNMFKHVVGAYTVLVTKVSATQGDHRLSMGRSACRVRSRSLGDGIVGLHLRNQKILQEQSKCETLMLGQTSNTSFTDKFSCSFQSSSVTAGMECN